MTEPIQTALVEREVTIEIRNRQGAVQIAKSFTVTLNGLMANLAASMAKIVLLQPNSANGSYDAYIGTKGAELGQYIGCYWPKAGDKAPRTDVVNVGISARKNPGVNAGFTPVMNRDKPVYFFTMLNMQAGSTPMQTLIVSLRDLACTIITKSGMVPDIATAADAVVNEVSVDITPLEIPVAATVQA